jgi:hypothetical protein
VRHGATPKSPHKPAPGKGFVLLKNIITTTFSVNNETKITKKPLLSGAYLKRGMWQKQRVS